MMKQLQSTSVLAGGNAPYVEELYEAYLRDPNQVPETWREYFDSLPIIEEGLSHDIPHSDIRAHFYQLTRHGGNRSHVNNEYSGDVAHERKQIGVTQLINAYRVRGHQLANVDPLGRNRTRVVREVDLREASLTEADYDTVFQTPSIYGLEEGKLRDIINYLQRTYCESIGYEFMYMNHTTQKDWLLQRIESAASKHTLSNDTKRYILDRITSAEGIEKYLHSKYVGQKRFSLEGGESLILIMSELVRRSGSRGAKELVIGMAHRGRLNVLVNILGKDPAQLFDEFEGKRNEALSAGDVKYHQGFSSDVSTDSGDSLHLTLAFNPSHLEVVSPVVQGSVRSRQDRHGDRNGQEVIPISIHGDAAFAGQGVVMETFNMSDSRGYSTKGTVHIIINNQIGFTTSNLEDARSTEYSTDVAKMINAPIFHVNGDDPEAVHFVTQLALDYRMQFQRDVIIDLVCYRRHGHNEADEPSATQPMMYKIIKALPTTRKLYADKLEQEGVLEKGEGDKLVLDFRDHLDKGDCVAPNIIENANLPVGLTVDWTPYIGVNDWRTKADTSVSIPTIQQLSDKLTTIPEGFQLHPRVKKIYEDRAKMAAGASPMDWGFAETMAYATLVTEGYPVRITGQDCGRGTFFHRHAVLHNQNDGSSHVPLRNLSDDQANFLVIDSVLSELAVLGFEYGYASHDPNSLVIWEAQFGDFANGGQMVIDQFITSGEAKWGRLCALTMLLPHGYEGQGPEHSSARVERFLQMCAEDNMSVIMPSTPAQCFHMLRRQMRRPLRRPMIVFTPKSLLRHRAAVSTLEELSEGQFQPVMDDASIKANANVKRIVMCSGKVYYDLLQQRDDENITDIALVRLEQLYPFPYDNLREILELYPNAETVVWCQEEPRNQGSWRANRHRIERVLDGKRLEFVGRPPSASPAVGYASLHAQQQKTLINQALLLEKNDLDY